jgi:hypothetical protein
MTDPAHTDDDEAARQPRRRYGVTLRIPFFSYSLSRDAGLNGGNQRTRIVLRSPLVSFEAEGDDLLQAAGRNAERKRERHSRDALKEVSTAIAAVVLGIAVNVFATGDSQGGGGLALGSAILGVAGVLFSVAVSTFVSGSHRRRATVGPGAIPPNLDRLAHELAAGRRAVADVRRAQKSRAE